MKMMELVDAWQQVIAMSEEDESGETDWEPILATVTADLEAKIESAAAVIRLQQERAERLKARAASAAKAADWLKALVLTVMQQSGIEKVKGDEYTVSLGQAAPTVDVQDPGAVPDDYLRDWTPPERWELVDKRKLVAALKEGDVPGAVLVPGAKHLRIR